MQVRQDLSVFCYAHYFPRRNPLLPFTIWFNYMVLLNVLTKWTYYMGLLPAFTAFTARFYCFRRFYCQLSQLSLSNFREHRSASESCFYFYLLIITQRPIVTLKSRLRRIIFIRIRRRIRLRAFCSSICLRNS